MKAFFSDVTTAPQSARQEASRELWVTLTVTLGTFFVGPLIFALIALPAPSGLKGAFQAFTGADIYIAAVSLLSISIYSISKTYDADGRDKFGFPHATTIILSAVLTALVSGAVYSTRIIYEAMPQSLDWREPVAGAIGWLTFAVACCIAYAVLVLRNDLEQGGSQRARQDENEFIREFQAAQAERED